MNIAACDFGQCSNLHTRMPSQHKESLTKQEYITVHACIRITSEFKKLKWMESEQLQLFI